MAILLALFIRTFVVQAFKIPSGSMLPTLLIGDHLLVNKFLYGLRIPFIGKRVLPGVPRPSTTTSSSSSSRRTAPRTSSSASRRSPARPSRSATRSSTSTASRSTIPTRFYEPDARLIPSSAARQLRAVHGARRPGLRDGRQPRPQPRQPFLGHGADRRHPRQGLHPVLVLGLGLVPAPRFGRMGNLIH